MVQRVHSALQVEAFVCGALLRLLEPPQDALVVILHDLDPVAFILVAGLITFDFVLSVFDSCLQLFLLVVKFVLESQEVLIERDAVSQQRLVPARLVLLIDFLVLKQLDL